MAHPRKSPAASKGIAHPPGSPEALRREAIDLALAQRLGATHGTGAVADAVQDLWHEMEARLVPTIGTPSVEALFVRALSHTAATFPWLAPAQEAVNAHAALTGLRERLRTEDPGKAAVVSAALLATYAELLSALIGVPLTDRLLAPVWAPPQPMPPKDPPQ